MNLTTYKMISGINLNNRNAFELINILRNFDSTVYIEKSSEKRQVNAKSLLGLLSFNIVCGDQISINTNNMLPEKIAGSINSILGNH